MAALRKRCDSQLEKRWLDLVDKLVLRPPSDAQYLIEACSTRPDFYYREHNAAIYIDGPPHDEPDQIREDEDITQRLMEMGYIVIRFHHKADWDEIFAGIRTFSAHHAHEHRHPFQSRHPHPRARSRLGGAARVHG